MSAPIDTVDAAENAYYNLLSKATVMGRLFDAAMSATHADVSLDWGGRSDDEAFWRGLDLMTRDIIAAADVMRAAVNTLHDGSPALKKVGGR
jgi:hypothetical protein